MQPTDGTGPSACVLSLITAADRSAKPVYAAGTTQVEQRHAAAPPPHLVGTKCGRTEEIDGGPVERWAQEVVANYGFQLTGHDAEVFGICAECSKKQDSASAK